MKGVAVFVFGQKMVVDYFRDELEGDFRAVVFDNLGEFEDDATGVFFALVVQEKYFDFREDFGDEAFFVAGVEEKLECVA